MAVGGVQGGGAERRAVWSLNTGPAVDPQAVPQWRLSPHPLACSVLAAARVVDATGWQKQAAGAGYERPLPAADVFQQWGLQQHRDALLCAHLWA